MTLPPYQQEAKPALSIKNFSFQAFGTSIADFLDEQIPTILTVWNDFMFI